MKVTVHNGWQSSVVPSQEELRAAAEKIIREGKSTLWGQSWNVYEASGLGEASEWLAEQARMVLREALWPSNTRQTNSVVSEERMISSHPPTV